MPLVARALIVSSIIALLSCGFVSFEDVSTIAPYSAYVGKQYQSKQKALIYRISIERNYKPDPSVYIVREPPGIGGPEVLARFELPVGSTFRVLKVMRCTDCYLDFKERVHVDVQFTSPSNFNDTKVQISTDLLGTTFVEASAPNNALQSEVAHPAARGAAERGR